MRTRRLLRLATTLSLVLLIAGAPGAFARGQARSAIGPQVFWSSSWQQLVFYLGHLWSKAGSELDPSGQPIPRTATGTETIDEGSGLDPDGVHKNGSALDPDGTPVPFPGSGTGTNGLGHTGSSLDPNG